MARRATIVLCLLGAAILLVACGSQAISVPKDDPTHAGAVLFADRCGGCHTLAQAGTQGSSTKVTDKERVDGPNLNFRKESVNDVLYAIRNGGFSGAIMPENIVVGSEADAIAKFLAAYSGKSAEHVPAVTITQPK